MHAAQHLCLEPSSQHELPHQEPAQVSQYQAALENADDLDDDVIASCGGSDDDDPGAERPVVCNLSYSCSALETSFQIESLEIEAPITCRIAHRQPATITVTAPFDLTLTLAAAGFDLQQLTYSAAETMTVAQIGQLSDAIQAGTAAATIEIAVHALTFFDQLATWMFRHDADTHTLARPGNTGIDIATTFELSDGEPVVPDFDTMTTTLQNFPCVLTRVHDVNERAIVHAALDLDLCTEAQRTRVAALFLAAEMTLRQQYVPNQVSSPAKKAWDANCRSLIQARVPITRGTAVFGALAQECLALKANGLGAGFIGAVRDRIKARLITANDWEEPCEDREATPYHWAVAKTLGSIFRTGIDRTPDALDVSPMTFLREMSTLLDTRPSVSLALQCGFGHCQEFATVTYVLLAYLMSQDPEIAAFFRHLVHAAEIAADHAFVTVGLVPQQRDAFNDDFVFELGAAIDALQDGQQAFICDAYLHPSLVPVGASDYFQMRAAHHGDDEDDDEDDADDDEDDAAPQQSFKILGEFAQGSEFRTIDDDDDDDDDDGT